ncbi:MAG: hypothetical protein EXX96DRAFT_564157 [Benjaminiella poitrasii]|nr:MAG: hypothetical protein EXX96DRAFT_564157 [Benjaminiella poitrasii]
MSVARIPLKTRSRNENSIEETSPKNAAEKIKPEKTLSPLKPSQNKKNITAKKGLQPSQTTKRTQDKTEPAQPKKTPTFTVYNDNGTDSTEQKLLKPIAKRKIAKASPSHPKFDLFDHDIFSEIDTPIYTLPTDCLIAIFKLCRGFENYCTLLGVCRRWRLIASQPFLWRELECEWTTFSRQIDLLQQPRRRFVQFDHVRSLTLTHSSSSVIRDPTIDIVKIAPLKQLTELRLINMNLTDMAFLLSWLKGIVRLHCERIHVTDNRSVNMAMFSGLRQLESLYLHFARPSALAYTYFTLTRDADGYPTGYERHFPPGLKALSIHNTYDYEEALYNTTNRDHLERLLVVSNNQQQEQDDIIVRWLQLEEKLVQKYHIFRTLCNLTSLTLGRVSSFTSRVWRQCLIPCSTKLEHLTMKNWDGLGKRESPQLYFRRARTMLMLRRQTTDQPPVVDDVEMAMAEFVSCLKNIKEIKLASFMCGQGLVKGLQRLKRKYRIIVDGVDSGGRIEEFEDKRLLNCKIMFHQERDGTLA